MRMFTHSRFRRGFTLVELMIAMALVGILTALIYGLFVHTSDSLSDVEAHADALDQSRFGIQQVRMGLLAAGSQATPNSRVDPWMISNQRHGANQPDIFAIIQDDDWQVQTVDELETMWLDGSHDRVASDGENPGSRFSSFVVIGAFDVPASMLVSFPDAGGASDIDESQPRFIIEGTERGLYRMLGYDPFDLSIVNDVQPPSDLDDQAETRLMRVRDSEGYSQIQPIVNATLDSSDDLGGAGGDGLVTGQAMEVELEDLYFRQAGEPAGFDTSVESDVSFDAAMIDAYWYYVRPARDNPTNLQLMRQRLDISAMVQDDDGAAEIDYSSLDDHRAGPPMILAERVVDFRVWFDCRDTVGQNVIDAQWQAGWEVDGDDCVADGNPHLAQVAHARLSTRTARENPNRPHYTLVNGWEGFEQQDGLMRTYEIVPEAEGSAAVVTTQTSVELTNFSIRNYEG